MTNKELRIKVAELCGYKYHQPFNDDITFVKPPKGYKFTEMQKRLRITEILPSEVPEYPEDLNAMYEAEKMLSHTAKAGEQQSPAGKFLGHLGRIAKARHTFDVWTSVHATARQRALAFVQTMEGLKQ